MAIAMKGGSRVPLRYFEEKKFKNHLKSLPDCQSVFRTKCELYIMLRWLWTWLLYGSRRSQQTENVNFEPITRGLYGQLFVIFFWCSFDLILWLYVFWYGFYTRKSQFSCNYWNPPPLTAAALQMIICKRQAPHSDNHERAWKTHFWDLSQWDKCVLSVKESNYTEKKIKIFTFVYGQGRGGWPPPPLTVSPTVKYPFFYDSPNIINWISHTYLKTEIFFWQ